MTNAMISSEEAQSYQSKGLSPRRRTYEVGMRGLSVSLRGHHLPAAPLSHRLHPLPGPAQSELDLPHQPGECPAGDRRHHACHPEHPLCHRGHPDLHPAPGGGGRHLPHRVRLQPQAGLCHRVRHRDSGRHPLYPVRPGGHADLLSVSWTWARPCWPAPSPWSS